MSPVGPELPPHLQSKRKRDSDEDSQHDETNKSDSSRSSSPESPGKRRRIVGPAPPPAPLDERPSTEPSPSRDSSSEDDDGYGPALPTAEDSINANKIESVDDPTYGELNDEDGSQEKKTQRDEWMMMPPKQDDLAARMDPTKMQARGFSKSKGLKGSSAIKDGDTSMWTETPEQKRKRLENEVLGVSAPPSTKTDPSEQRRTTATNDEKTARKVREHNEKHRGKSLLEEHKGSTKAKDDDDPSKRAFDYERDMGGSSKMGHAQRRDMIGRAGNMGSRFSKGGYL